MEACDPVRYVTVTSDDYPGSINISFSSALPHSVTEDNVYEGFFIPKGAPFFSVACVVTDFQSGAVVIGNTW